MLSNFEKTVVLDGRTYETAGVYICKMVNDSFSHEYGVEHRGHYEVESVDIEEVWMVGDEGTIEEVGHDPVLWAKLEEELVETLVS